MDALFTSANALVLFEKNTVLSINYFYCDDKAQTGAVTEP